MQEMYNWNIVESGVKHHQTNKHTNISDNGGMFIPFRQIDQGKL
jgi:hypothetical protein